MKTKSAVFLVTTIFSISHCVGQSNVVYYGVNSNALDVVFVDTNLSPKAQSVIITDLRICLSEWGKTTEVRLGADDPAFVAHLYNPDRCPHYPEGIDFPDDIVNTPNGFALQIPKELSDAYTNAFKLVAANAKACTAANAFIKFVSSTNFVNLAPKALPNYLLEKGVTADEIIADAQESISQLRNQTYYAPSVLSFRHLAIGPGEPTSSNLWMYIPCSSALLYSDSQEWGCFPAIWHMGKWKFCIWEDNP